MRRMMCRNHRPDTEKVLDDIARDQNPCWKRFCVGLRSGRGRWLSPWDFSRRRRMAQKWRQDALARFRGVSGGRQMRADRLCQLIVQRKVPAVVKPERRRHACDFAANFELRRGCRAIGKIQPE